MSVPLPTINLAPPAVGQTGTIDLARFHISAVPVDPNTGPFTRLELVNESGAGLTITFSQNPGVHWRVPANKQRTLPIPPGEAKATWAVEYVFGSSFAGMVLLTFYEAWEPEPPPISDAGGANPGNQTRTIAGGMTPFPIIGRAVALTNGLDINLRTDAFFPSGPPLVSPNHPVAYFYLYWARLRLANPPAATNQAADCNLVADLMNGATVLGSLDMHYMYVSNTNAPAANATDVLSSDDFVTNNPGAYLFNNIAALPWTGVRWRLHVNGVIGTPNGYFSFGVGLDIINSVAPGTHGNFSYGAQIY